MIDIPLGQDFALILSLSQARLAHHLEFRMPFYTWDFEEIANRNYSTIDILLLMEGHDGTCRAGGLDLLLLANRNSSVCCLINIDIGLLLEGMSVGIC